MDNKKYLDKVIDHLVKGTNIDYEEKIISSPLSPSFSSSFFLYPSLSSSPLSSFSKYCRKQFGLIEEEIEYVWNEYKIIIKNKIEDGQ